MLSRNPTHIIEPFNRNEGPPGELTGLVVESSIDEEMNNRRDLPRIVTTTGLVFRLSGSGNVMATVRTDPKLVPIHNVGMSSVGSERGERDLKKAIRNRDYTKSKDANNSPFFLVKLSANTKH